MIIDIHTHCFPDPLAARAVSSLSHTSGLKPFQDGTIDGLMKSMSESGVDLSVLQPIATKPDQTVSINKWAAEVNNDKIISFGTIHPEFENFKDTIKWLTEHGFKGIKFHPEYQNFFVDDPAYFKLYEAIFNAGLIIIFHSGVDLSYSEPFRCTPKRLHTLLDTFPGSKIIAAHMGGYRYWNDTEKYLIGRDIYLDTAFSLPELGQEKASRIIKEHGASKILFASDSPWADPGKDISIIKSLPINDTEKNNILGENAKKLLSL